MFQNAAITTNILTDGCYAGANLCESNVLCTRNCYYSGCEDDLIFGGNATFLDLNCVSSYRYVFCYFP